MRTEVTFCVAEPKKEKTDDAMPFFCCCSCSTSAPAGAADCFAAWKHCEAQVNIHIKSEERQPRVANCA